MSTLSLVQGCLPGETLTAVRCADYSIEENAYWSERVYSHVFRLLNEYGILMEGMLLKPNMCLPGDSPTDCKDVFEPWVAEQSLI